MSWGRTPIGVVIACKALEKNLANRLKKAVKGRRRP
jgi:hypothetical protein